MHLRFQGQAPNIGTSSRLGIFQLAFELRDRFDLPDYAFDTLNHHLLWLKANLKSPAELERDESIRAISWFKDSAEEPLRHIWSIKAVLEEFGYHIEIIKSRDPGVVIYQDEWQVVAKPRRKRSVKRLERTR